MTQIPCLYDDRIRSHSYGSIVCEGDSEDPRHGVGPTHSYLPQHMTLHVDVGHPYEHVPLSDWSFSHHGGPNPPRSTYPLCLLPGGNELSGDIPTECGDFGFPQPPEMYHVWGPLHPPSNLAQNAIRVISPSTIHHPPSDLALHCNSSSQQSPSSTVNDQVSYVDNSLQAPSNYLHAVHRLNDFDPPLHSNFTSQPDTETLEASYPCLWTEGGVVCDVTVQATRSQMNRHLHAYHGFGGTDTRQTRCYWAGCGEIMQQGSIARHMVTCHLQAKVTCPTCSKKLSRQDVISKHQRICPAASAWR